MQGAGGGAGRTGGAYAVGRNVSRGRGLEELLDRRLEVGWFEEAVAETVLLPEGEEELEIGTVYRARRRVAGVCSSGAGQVRGDLGAVRGKVIKLLLAGLGDLKYAPVGRAGGAVGEDKGETGPQVVHVRAAELVVGAESGYHLFPDRDQGLDVGVPRDTVRKVGHGRGGGGGRAPNARHGKAALDRIKVGPFGEREGGKVVTGG